MDNKTIKSINNSKDIPIIQISSRQTQNQIKNIAPPIKPKEVKR